MRAALAVALAACTTQPSKPDAPPPIQLDVDVVVSPTQVRIYTNNTDGTSGPGSEEDVLPPAETCVDDGDDFSPTPSCLTAFAIIDHGTQVAYNTPNAYVAKLLAVDFASLDAPVLRLVGCGGDATIPLDVQAPTTPTLMAAADDAARTITATWGGATAVMLTFGDGTYFHRCQTRMTPYVFQLPELGPLPSLFQNVDAQSLAGPTTVATELGNVRVWSGGITDVTP